MKTENLSTLKIHKLTQAQYDRELAAGRIDETALYLTPDNNESQSDWNENDETSTSYIQNRPFYTGDPIETEIVNGTFTFADIMGDGSLYSTQFTSTIESTEGMNIKIIFNNTEYNCTFTYYDHIGNYVGNGSILNSIMGTSFEDTGEPFVLLGQEKQFMFITTNTGTEQNVSILSNVSTIVQLDEKYISYKPGLNVEGKTFTIDGVEVIAGKGAEIFNSYEGNGINKATGIGSHAEGFSTTASGERSHAEGWFTIASGSYSHAEGQNTTASGLGAHAEGERTTASGRTSHAEGGVTTASGMDSHAEGNHAKASGVASHAEGFYTLASSDYQHTQGKYNIEDTENKYAHIVGNGTSTAGSNAHTLDWDGNAEFQGDVKANACGGKNPISLVELYNTIQTLTERIAVLEAALNTDSLTETDANALVEEVFN